MSRASVRECMESQLEREREKDGHAMQADDGGSSIESERRRERREGGGEYYPQKVKIAVAVVVA